MKQEQDGLSSVGDRIKQKTPPFFKKLRTIGLVVAAIGTSLVMAPVALPVLVTTIGGYLIVLSLTPDESGVVPFIASRSAGAVVLTIVVGLSALWFWARTRRPVHATSIDVTSGDDGKLNWRLGVWFAVGAGLSQAFGDILILAALRSGELAVVSVVVAMYPAGTILLATLILKERLTVVQGIGLVLALGAVAMLALG
jgi:drug/metabolite transporter (DMT)-like permease